jgi:peptidyl-dipeptidase Dcp
MTSAVNNPLLQSRWTAQFGVAPFDKIDIKHYRPAFAEAFKQHRAEIAKIANASAKPSFKNTIETLEGAGRTLSRVCEVFFNLSSADTNDALQAIERDLAPLLSKHESAIFLNAKLFARVDDLFQRRAALGLEAEQLRILERTHLAFVRAGANLKGKARKRVAEVNAHLAQLATTFSQNVLADEQSWHLILNGDRDLQGLPDGVRSAASRTAASLGHPGKHAITLARSSVESFLQFSDRRDLREKAFKAWISRGANGGKHDNRALISEAMALRAELAHLMGYASYAEYTLDDTMAKTPAAASGLLDQVWPAALKRAGEERDALQKLARSSGQNQAIAAWDWRYYAEKERKARYDLDDGELRPYFQLDQMVAAAFYTATQLFGLKFKEREDIPKYHPDVRTFEVLNKKGEHVGVFFGDYFARPSKRSGAWMSSFRTQNKMKSATPIIVNVLNFARGAEGEQTLLSFDDARTLFHEFGHGLHGLLSNVTYPSLAGTNVSRDFVELPSQLYEHWLETPEVLKKFAVHVKTGKPIPDTLLKRVKAMRAFNQGFATVEFISSAYADMALHDIGMETEVDADQFEKDLLAKIKMPDEISMRHRVPHFLHIMGGYGAGYYSYLWSEVMDADAFQAFKETGNVFDAKVAKKLKDHIYSAGNSRDPHDAYIAFRGRAPAVEGLLKKRGLI